MVFGAFHKTPCTNQVRQTWNRGVFAIQVEFGHVSAAFDSHRCRVEIATKDRLLVLPQAPEWLSTKPAFQMGLRIQPLDDWFLTNRNFCRTQSKNYLLLR